MPSTCYKLANKQDSTPSGGDTGKIFYTNAVSDVVIPQGASVYLAGASNGSGETFVDDIVYLTLIDQSNPGDRAFYSHDYSNGCSGVVTPEQPTDLSKEAAFSAMAGKTVTASIEFWDKCGGYKSGSDFYICIDTPD